MTTSGDFHMALDTPRMPSATGLQSKVTSQDLSASFPHQPRQHKGAQYRHPGFISLPANRRVGVVGEVVGALERVLSFLSP